MEKNLIVYVEFKKGTRVKIRPDSRFYTGDAEACNPKDVPGIITDDRGDWKKVIWDNGKENSYEDVDLMPLELAGENFVDTNKIYLEKEPKDLLEIFEILYPLDKKRRSQKSFYKSEADGAFLLQCNEGKMRSFDDIYIIANTYFPGIDIRIVFKELLLFNTKLSQIKEDLLHKSLGNCSTMRRIRYTNSMSTIRQIWLGVDCAKYDSIHTWRDLFNMIYINSASQLKEWYVRELSERENKPKPVLFQIPKKPVVIKEPHHKDVIPAAFR